MSTSSFAWLASKCVLLLTIWTPPEKLHKPVGCVGDEVYLSKCHISPKAKIWAS
jgi:hypothetical protein